METSRAEGRGVPSSLRELWQRTRAVIERRKVDGNLQACWVVVSCERK